MALPGRFGHEPRDDPDRLLLEGPLSGADALGRQRRPLERHRRQLAAIVKDLTDNRTGIADKWSAYRAEDLHEDYHWINEWQGQSKPKFDEALTEIAALEEADDGTGPSTQYAANKILEPKATNIFTTKVREARRAFNALGDSAGDPPYVAQAPAIDALIKRVQDHAAANKWA